MDKEQLERFEELMAKQPIGWYDLETEEFTPLQSTTEKRIAKVKNWFKFEVFKASVLLSSMKDSIKYRLFKASVLVTSMKDWLYNKFIDLLWFLK